MNSACTLLRWVANLAALLFIRRGEQRAEWGEGKEFSDISGKSNFVFSFQRGLFFTVFMKAARRERNLEHPQVAVVWSKLREGGDVAIIKLDIHDENWIHLDFMNERTCRLRSWILSKCRHRRDDVPDLTRRRRGKERSSFFHSLELFNLKPFSEVSWVTTRRQTVTWSREQRSHWRGNFRRNLILNGARV